MYLRESIASAEALASDAEAKKSEATRLCRILEIERHTLGQQNQDIDAAIQELQQKEWALDQRMKELDAREEELGQLAAQYQQQLETALWEIEKDRERLEVDTRRVTQQRYVQEEFLKKLDAVIPLQVC